MSRESAQSLGAAQDMAISNAVEKERSRLLSFIRGRIPNPDDAEDIVQDVFYELVEAYRLMRPVEQLAAWLFTVARNKITDRYRKKKPHSLEDELRLEEDEEGNLVLADLLPSNELAAEDRLLAEATMEMITEALEELPETQREVFIRHELEGKSLAMIAAETNMPLKTVISRKHYAVLHLRRRLADWYDEWY
jgi:RNA polymerase sigma factor (sigma-70 family)